MIHDNRVTLPEIANQLGMSKTTLEELLLIERKLTSEVKELLDNGIFNKTIASKVLTKLSSEEQKLNIEISENEVRKDFSKAERIEYARRLEKIESLKAKERQELGTNLSPNLDKGRTDELIANKLGIGGKDTYRKEKYIVDNKESLSPIDFVDWDEGKLSTNKAYNKIKEQMLEATKISSDLY